MTTAWILPGGASLGATQVGQIEAMLEAGVVPDMIVGTSAGSLNAAWLASDPTTKGAATLRSLWLGVRRRDIFPVSPLTIAFGLLGRRDHTVSDRRFLDWLERTVPFRRLEDAAVPLTVTATDLDTGDAVYLASGPAVPALAASCSMPGVFPPQIIDGRVLVDGGMAADAPVGLAIQAGADRVYVLPTLGPVPPGRPRGATDVMLRSIGVVLGNARRTELAAWVRQADVYVVPAPSIPGISPFSFGRSLDLMEAARELTEVWLPGARPVEAAMSGVEPVAPGGPRPAGDDGAVDGGVVLRSTNGAVRSGSVPGSVG